VACQLKKHRSKPMISVFFLALFFETQSMQNTTFTTLSRTNKSQQQLPTMVNQPILCHPLPMNTLNRTRTSILRPNEHVEIQGSCWPRILILSESAERRKKSSSKKSGYTKASTTSATKKSRRIKNKIDLIRQVKKSSPGLTSVSVVPRSLSPSFEAYPNSLSSISAFDQNTSPSWKHVTQETSKTKMSSFTGRPLIPKLENFTKPIGQSSSGLKSLRRRKSKEGMVAPR
jgi:hypothetical protein